MEEKINESEEVVSDPDQKNDLGNTYSLRELEKMVKMNVRLKNELNVDSRGYWKRTHSALQKISERLVKLANKVGQLK